MPGGTASAWEAVQPILQGIAAVTDDGLPCCDWVGPDGAGHYVKMVHNGIEYGDIQIIAEAYQIMKLLLGMSNDEISAVFAEWDKGKLDSYLIEIAAEVMAYKDEEETAIIDVIMDTAGQKGTGKWTAINALEQGIPLTLIGEAVNARFLSALKDERTTASKTLNGPDITFDGDRDTFLAQLHDAVYASKIVSYAQGFMLMRGASAEYDWTLDYARLAHMWREGCIIRSAFLTKIAEAYDNDAELVNLLLAPYFEQEVENAQAGWRAVTAMAIQQGIPVPALSAALTFFDGYRLERGSANMIQAFARLLRSAHLRARGPRYGRVLPHRLDGRRRKRHVGQLLGVTLSAQVRT